MKTRILLYACAALTIGAAETPVHEQVEDNLVQANRARTTRDAEASAWGDTQAKLETLLASIGSVAESARAETEGDRARTRQLNAATVELRRGQEAGAQTQGACVELMEVIHAALDEIAAESIPGLVPEKQKAYGALKEQWQQTMSRWKATEDAAATIEPRIMVGLLGDQALKVKALLVGTTLGWWVDEASSRAGFLVAPTTPDGAVELVEFPANSPARAQLITAFMVIEGRRAPQWIYLPIKEVVK